jgi:hypothetical protein
LKRSKAAAVVVDTVCAWLRAAQSDADADDGTETETPLSSQFAGRRSGSVSTDDDANASAGACSFADASLL